MSQKRFPAQFDAESFLQTLGRKIKVIESVRKAISSSKGTFSNAVFYIQKGRVKLTVTSVLGKSAIIGVLNGGGFFGEGCIAGQILRTMTATAITDCVLLRIEKGTMIATLHKRHDFSEFFMAYVLSRTCDMRRTWSTSFLTPARND